MDDSSPEIIKGQDPPILPVQNTYAEALDALGATAVQTWPAGTSPYAMHPAYQVPCSVPKLEAPALPAGTSMAGPAVLPLKAEERPPLKPHRFEPAVANASAYYLVNDDQGKADKLRLAALAPWYRPYSNTEQRLDGGGRPKRRVDWYIAHAHVFAERVIDSEAPGVAMLAGVERDTELSRYLPELAALAKALSAPGWIFGPELEAMRSAWESMGVHWSQLGLLQYANTRAPNGMRWGDFYNLFIERIREQSRTPKYKAAMRLRAQQASRRKKRIDRLVDSSFKRRSKICVVRVDLSYLKLHQYELSSEQVRADLARLQANRRHKGIFRHLVASVVRLEYASSFHFHVALLFDGHEVQHHAYYGDRVIEYWETTITKGKGHGHNCSRDEDRYRKARVPFVCGLTNWTEQGRVADLKGVLHYLAKEEQYLAAKVLQRERTFWTTVIKAESGKPKRGRPRGLPRKAHCGPGEGRPAVRENKAEGEGA